MIVSDVDGQRSIDHHSALQSNTLLWQTESPGILGRPIPALFASAVCERTQLRNNMFYRKPGHEVVCVYLMKMWKLGFVCFNILRVMTKNIHHI